jgi:hypothetical protein
MLNTLKINKTIKIKAGGSLIEMHLHHDIKDFTPCTPLEKSTNSIYTEIAHSNDKQLIKEILDEVKKELEDKFSEMSCYFSNHNNYNSVFNIQVGVFVSEQAHRQ